MGEEDGHGGQHDADNPGHGQVYAVDQEAVQPPGHADAGGQTFEGGMDGVHQQVRQQSGRHVGALDGDPEYRGQEKQHEGKSQPAAGHQAVDAAVKVEARLGAAARDGAVGHPGSVGVDGLYQGVVQVGAGFPAHGVGGGEDLFGSGFRIHDCVSRAEGGCLVSTEKLL